MFRPGVLVQAVSNIDGLTVKKGDLGMTVQYTFGEGPPEEAEIPMGYVQFNDYPHPVYVATDYLKEVQPNAPAYEACKEPIKKDKAERTESNISGVSDSDTAIANIISPASNLSGLDGEIQYSPKPSGTYHDSDPF